MVGSLLGYVGTKAKESARRIFASALSEKKATDSLKYLTRCISIVGAKSDPIGSVDVIRLRDSQSISLGV